MLHDRVVFEILTHGWKLFLIILQSVEVENNSTTLQHYWTAIFENLDNTLFAIT